MDLGGHGVELARLADLDDLDSHAQGACRRRQSRYLDPVGWTIGIEYGSNARQAGHRELEKIQSPPDQRVFSCVDGPRPTRDHLAYSTEVACCHKISMRRWGFSFVFGWVAVAVVGLIYNHSLIVASRPTIGIKRQPAPPPPPLPSPGSSAEAC